MPLITYNLLKHLMKGKEEVTTNEIINHIFDKSPSHLENLVNHMIILEKSGFIKKVFDRKREMYVWSLGKPNLRSEEMLINYPELYEQSLYGTEPVNGIYRKRRKP